MARADRKMRLDRFGRVRVAGEPDGRHHYFCAKCGRSRARTNPVGVVRKSAWAGLCQSCGGKTRSGHVHCSRCGRVASALLDQDPNR